MRTNFVLVAITCPSNAEAYRIAGALMEKRLIACANILKGVESIFRWKQKIERAKEAMVLMKTSRSHVKAIIAMVKKMHSYEVPEIIAVPIGDGNGDYLRWIDECVHTRQGMKK